MSVWSTYWPSTSCKISKKSNEAILRKLIKYGKSVHFRPFWSIFGTMRIFFKNPALSLFSTYQPLTSCKISKNSNEPILRKLSSKKWTDGRMDKRTDRHEIIGPSQSVGPKIRKFNMQDFRWNTSNFYKMQFKYRINVSKHRF